MKKNKHPLITGTLLLTAAGLASRIIGFFYKIFLVSLIGAEGIGIYQMVFPTYMLCVSLASSGIQTAVSRFTAENLSTGRPQKAQQLFLTGLSMALGISVILSSLLFSLSKPLAVYLLKEERCLSLLRLMALSIPFEVLHNCANGYFLGQQKTGFPALSQLLEQSVRVLATLLFYQIMLQNHISPAPELAAAGMLAAEMVAALAAITVLAFQKTPRIREASTSENNRSYARSLLKVALPVTSNRLLLNVLKSVEAAMIPLLLQKYYVDASTALSVYGIFSGMAIPLIMLPSAISGSFSMMLLPAISEAHALKDDKKIAATIQSSLLLCFFLGITCTAAFLLFGTSMGRLLYGNNQVGSYLLTLAWICPLLYLTTVDSSILHGLGKTMSVFFHNLIGQLIRLLFSLFFIPHFGIQGCLWGVLASQLTTAFLSTYTLKRSVSFSFNTGSLILFPCGCILSATGFLKLLQYFLSILRKTDQWIPFLLAAGIWGLTVLIVYGWLGRKLKLLSS